MIKLALFVGLLATLSFAKVPLLGIDSATAIDGEYLFVFHSNITHYQQLSHIFQLGLSLGTNEALLRQANIGNFHAFSARLSAKSLKDQLTYDDVIKYAEANQAVHAYCQQEDASDYWGLDRIDQQSIDGMDEQYRYGDLAGLGVDAYIVDTGILVSHTDFGGRAIWGANFIDDENTDCNGHGTHVAGTVGGTQSGVAKKVTLIAVKVLSCSGGGTIDSVVDGIEYVASESAKRKKPSVANMSLGGSYSLALNDAVAAAIETGVTFVVAAGNSYADACSYSPASTPTAISVGATSIDNTEGYQVDVRSSFSNFGTCVSILAPGELIKSAWIGSDTATHTISGTSMASPHVAGAAALYLASNPSSTPASIKSYLVNVASAGVVDLNCPSSTSSCNATPNMFLYSACSSK